MNKISLPFFLGNTFYSSQEYTVNGNMVVPVGTKFVLIARQSDGTYLYQAQYLMPVGLAY